MKGLESGLATSKPIAEKEKSISKDSQVSLDGEHYIDVPPRLGKLISIGLKLQKRIDKHIEEVNLDFDSTVDIVNGMNCHKTVLFARGEISYDELRNSGIEAMHNGHPEILSLANDNPENLLLFSEDIEAYVNEHPTGFPYSVHAIRKEGRNWIPAHSVLLLGRDETGELVCFHKAGPYLDMPFELASLKSVIKPYDNEATVFLMLPLPPEEMPKESEKNSSIANLEQPV
jgi:hypothetical protein